MMKKNIISVERCEIVCDRIVKIRVEWNRRTRSSILFVDGRMVGGVSGPLAERYFKRFGLLSIPGGGIRTIN